MKNIYLIIILCFLTSTLLYADDPTTPASATLWFQGTLTPSGAGYSGTIPCIDDSGFSGTMAGFDVYARDGAYATYDKAGSGSQDYAEGIVSGHDAYNTAGGWGATYNPDCADYYHYQLKLSGNNWAVQYNGGSGATCAPMSGRVNWDTRVARETGRGKYYSGMGTAESPGYAADYGNGTTSNTWDMDWSWGSEYIPLQIPYGIAVTDQGGGIYRVSLTPITPPTCSTYAVGDVTDSTAVVGGCVMDDGSMDCEVRFVYWVCGLEPLATEWVGGFESHDVTYPTLTNLMPGTIYSYQIEVRNLAGTCQGSPRQFTTPACSTGLTYIDATIGECANTTLATGEPVVADDPGTVPSGKDNLWRGRAFANGGTILESGGSWEGNGNTEDCPRLKTTVPVPMGCYEVYVNFWADAAQWRIGASLTDDANELPLYLANDPNDPSVYAEAISFGCCSVPMLAEGNRFLWQAYLGTITTNNIVVYIDDEPNHLTGNSRTWYDGISYKPAAPGITYVDATIGESGNTTYAAGGDVNAVDPGTVPSGKDNLWRERAYANNGTIYESGGSWEGNGNTEDCPRLKTSVAVPEGDYDVYVYFWADAAQWRIGASLTDDANELPLYLANDPNNPLSATVKEFGCNAIPMMAEGNRTLFVAPLGNTGVTSVIDVYIDDEPNHLTGNSRTWYDGIGYKPASPKITYVDATIGEGGNTTYATGEDVNAVDPGTVPSGKDNLWRERAFANNGTIYESGGSWEGNGNTEDCPRLLTTVEVPMGCYEVFVYQWADAAQWRIGASLENLADNVLPLYLCNDPNDLATQLAVGLDFGGAVPMLAEGNRLLWQVSLGNTGPTDVIDIYIDDDPNHLTGNSRTWYDGIGYRAR